MLKPKLFPTSKEIAFHKDIFPILDPLAPIYLSPGTRSVDRKSHGPNQKSIKGESDPSFEQSFQDHGCHESGIPSYTCHSV